MNKNGWKLKWMNKIKRMKILEMEEQNKMMKQPITTKNMFPCKLYLFTTKRSTLIETLHVHIQEVCSHWLLNNMRLHIFNTISHCFVFEFSSSNFLHLRSFLPLEKKITFFPHLHPNLLAPSFLQLLSICNCYTSILQWKNENLWEWSHWTPWKLWLNTH
jgi:hypothetical protein